MSALSDDVFTALEEERKKLFSLNLFTVSERENLLRILELQKRCRNHSPRAKKMFVEIFRELSLHFSRSEYYFKDKLSKLNRELREEMKNDEKDPNRSGSAELLNETNNDIDLAVDPTESQEKDANVVTTHKKSQRSPNSSINDVDGEELIKNAREKFWTYTQFDNSALDELDKLRDVCLNSEELFSQFHQLCKDLSTNMGRSTNFLSLKVNSHRFKMKRNAMINSKPAKRMHKKRSGTSTSKPSTSREVEGRTLRSAQQRNENTNIKAEPTTSRQNTVQNSNDVNTRKRSAETLQDLKPLAAIMPIRGPNELESNNRTGPAVKQEKRQENSMVLRHKERFSIGSIKERKPTQPLRSSTSAVVNAAQPAPPANIERKEYFQNKITYAMNLLECMRIDWDEKKFKSVRMWLEIASEDPEMTKQEFASIVATVGTCSSADVLLQVHEKMLKRGLSHHMVSHMEDF